jgi:HEAT repeat protein
VNTLARWKVACALLGALATASTVKAWRDDRTSAPAAQAQASRGGLPAKVIRPLRVSAASVGISEQELIDRVLSSRSLKEMAIVVEKLGAVGTDDAVRSLEGLLSDPRRGVPEMILGMMGAIATEHAVEVLLAHAKDERPQVRSAAVRALGVSQSEKAEGLLLALAQSPADPDQSTAIQALGALQSDRAVATLLKIAESGDAQVASSAVWAMSGITSDKALAALRKLVHSPNLRVASTAIGSLDSIDEEMAEVLLKIVRGGNADLAGTALAALAKAPVEVAMPVLKQMATSGPQGLRWSAISALGEIGDESAVATLGDILRTGDRQSAAAAAQALGSMGTPEARELIIEAALSDRSDWTGAIYQLGAMQGEDVEAALADAAKNGSSRDKQIVMPRLLRMNNAEALRSVVETASTGNRSDQADAMRMLADAGTPEATAALMGLVERSRGQTRVSALEAMAQTNPADPRLSRMLSDSLFSGRKNEAATAAAVLGRLGTEESQQALLTALSGSDKELSMAAAQALGMQGGLSDSAKAALVAAASRGDARTKTTIMHQLVDQGTPEGLRMAEEILNHKDSDVAQSAIAALQRSGTPEARALIERTLSAKDPALRAAAVEGLAQNPTESSAEALIRMVRDEDARVRSSAMSALAQVGTERATQTLIDSARRGTSEDRIAAISGLSMVRDAKSSKALADLISDPDEAVAQSAISSSFGGGAEVDAALVRMLSAGSSQGLRLAAASQLRNRGTDLDEATEKRVTELAGPSEMYGGYGYGGGNYYRYRY